MYAFLNRPQKLPHKIRLGVWKFCVCLFTPKAVKSASTHGLRKRQFNKGGVTGGNHFFFK